MTAVMEILFRSKDLVVRFTPGGARETAFLTFAPYSDFGDLDRPGFGEHFFRSRGFDAIHVIGRSNHWYQHPEMDAVIAAIAARMARYHRVVAYGSSMGGFAALTYGAACGAKVGLALSPQYSVDPAIVPFENRWLNDVKAIRFREDKAYPRLPIQYIVYDPLDDFDCRHAALLAEVAPTILFRARNGGHPVGAFLNETGLLEPLLEAISSDSLVHCEAPLVEATLRDRRQRSGQYLFTLARRVPNHRPRQKLALAAAAVATNPDSPAYLTFKAEMLAWNGQPNEADALYVTALACPDAGPHPGLSFVAHYRATGRNVEAERLAAAQLTDFPSARLLRAALWAIRIERLGQTGGGRLALRLKLASLWFGIVDRLHGLHRNYHRRTVNKPTEDAVRSAQTA